MRTRQAFEHTVQMSKEQSWFLMGHYQINIFVLTLSGGVRAFEVVQSCVLHHSWTTKISQGILQGTLVQTQFKKHAASHCILLCCVVSAEFREAMK